MCIQAYAVHIRVVLFWRGVDSESNLCYSRGISGIDVEDFIFIVSFLLEKSRVTHTFSIFISTTSWLLSRQALPFRQSARRQEFTDQKFDDATGMILDRRSDDFLDGRISLVVFFTSSESKDPKRTQSSPPIRHIRLW